jgi:hypothetical protein
MAANTTFGRCCPTIAAVNETLPELRGTPNMMVSLKRMVSRSRRYHLGFGIDLISHIIECKLRVVVEVKFQQNRLL